MESLSGRGGGAPDMGGQAWMERLIADVGALHAEVDVLLFGVGQLGAAATFDPARALALADALDRDARDLRRAAEKVSGTTRDITANVRRNVRRREGGG